MTPKPVIARDGEAKRLLTDMVAAHAAALARRGKYHDAEELIEPIIATGEARAELVDLMARIRVQQGRVDEAIVLWRTALAADGANAKFRAALDSLARNRHPARRRITWVIGLTLGAAIALTGLGLEVSRRAGHGVTLNTSSHPVVQPSALPDSAPFRSQYTKAEIQGDSIRIGFTQPLFREGVQLTPYGQRALADLSERLRPFASTVEIAIIGKTDGVRVRKPGRYSDNSVLGLLRAIAVYNQFRSHIADLPLPRVAAESTDGSSGITRQAQHRTAAVLLRFPAGK
jgi:tetratricopeptide (TPR) repeat protein